MKDTYFHKGLRKNMVLTLKAQGLEDMKILQVLNTIPRHQFMDEAFAEWAYKDVPFKIEADQTISQPSTVAKMTQLLGVQPKDRILEVGTGSGYQACVLSMLGAKVYTIERQPELYRKTSKLLEQLGFGMIRTLYGDGYQGYERFAPFDKVIVTAGAPFIPQPLIDQLKPNGVLVIPVDNEDGTQTMFKIFKEKDGKIHKSSHGIFTFVPMLPGVNA